MGNEGRDQGDVSKAEECYRVLAKHQKRGESGEQILSSQHSEEPNPADTLISDIYFQNGRQYISAFYAFLSLWYFITAALPN